MIDFVDCIEGRLDPVGSSHEEFLELRVDVVDLEHPGLDLLETGLGGDGGSAPVRGAAEGGEALGDVVRADADLLDDLVELEVERAEAGSLDIPVRLLAEQGQVGQIDEGLLERLVDDGRELVSHCYSSDVRFVFWNYSSLDALARRRHVFPADETMNTVISCHRSPGQRRAPHVTPPASGHRTAGEQAGTHARASQARRASSRAS